MHTQTEPSVKFGLFRDIQDLLQQGLALYRGGIPPASSLDTDKSESRLGSHVILQEIVHRCKRQNR